MKSPAAEHEDTMVEAFPSLVSFLHRVSGIVKK
jgi:hypothetical protein